MLRMCKILLLRLPNNAISRSFHFRDDVICPISDIFKESRDLKCNLFLVKTNRKCVTCWLKGSHENWFVSILFFVITSHKALKKKIYDLRSEWDQINLMAFSEQEVRRWPKTYFVWWWWDRSYQLNWHKDWIVAQNYPFGAILLPRYYSFTPSEVNLLEKDNFYPEHKV